MAKAKGAQASKLLTAGSYEYVLTNSQGIGLSSGANTVVDFLAASESLLTWVRCHYHGGFRSEAQPIDATLCVWKADGAAVMPDITDSDVVETLRRDGKLFFLKHVQIPGVGSGRGLQWETEFRNVKLRAGERLNWGIWDHAGNIAAPGYNEFFVLEYRLVTV